MRVGLWAYPIEQLASWDAFEHKLEAGFAAAAGCGLCVVPEYASMELTSLTGGDTLAAQVDALQPLFERYLAAYDRAAQRHAMTIVGGSFPRRVGTEIHNQAHIHTPAGRTLVEKQQMTRFEREQWNVASGSAQPVVNGVGVAICYDSEFPLLVRRLVVAGADIICVPSCTDSAHGYHRVRVACQARALENQCYVVQAPTVGDAPWSIAVDVNVGASGVFAPPDRGFPEDGVVALGPYNTPGWTFAELDLDAIARVRREGAVFNHRDWDNPKHLG